MAIWAIINETDNKCDNVVVLNEGVNWPTPDAHYRIDITGLDVGIDWIYDPNTGGWTPPPPPPEPELVPPSEVTGANGPTVV